MSPSTNMQECTVDLNAKEIPFSCIVDGNESIYAWQIKIYKLSDGSLVFDTGKKTLDTPFFPINEKNKNMVFGINLRDYYSSAEKCYTASESTYDKTKRYYKRSGEEGKYEYTLYEYNESTWNEDYSSLYYMNFVNSSDAYCWTIGVWGYADKTYIESCEEVFYANSVPTISIGYRSVYSPNQEDYSSFDGSPLTSREYYFKAKYIQDEGVQLKRYGWRLKDVDNGQILMDTISHNQVYGTVDNILCSYNGFAYNGKYSLELYIETQNGDKLVSKPIIFSTTYAITYLSNDFKVETLKQEPAVMLNWADSIVIGGSSNAEKNQYIKDYPVKGSTSVKLENNEYVSFDYGANSTLNVSEDSYMVLSTQLHRDVPLVIFGAEGVNNDGYEVVRKLTYEDGVFSYYVLGANGVTLEDSHKVTHKPNRYVWYIILMSPILKNENGDDYVKLTVTESRAVGGAYPSINLYPNNKVYPFFGEWDKLNKEEVK